jgi:hypothetical protein
MRMNFRDKLLKDKSPDLPLQGIIAAPCLATMILGGL